MKAPEDRKGPSFSVRFKAEDLHKIKAACHRDMIKPAIFAEKAILKAVDDLMWKQKRYGYACSFNKNEEVQ